MKGTNTSYYINETNAIGEINEMTMALGSLASALFELYYSFAHSNEKRKGFGNPTPLFRQASIN